MFHNCIFIAKSADRDLQGLMLSTQEHLMLFKPQILAIVAYLGCFVHDQRCVSSGYLITSFSNLLFPYGLLSISCSDILFSDTAILNHNCSTYLVEPVKSLPHAPCLVDIYLQTLPCNLIFLWPLDLTFAEQPSENSARSTNVLVMFHMPKLNPCHS